jgi:amino-acid N-acetyltransferase
MIFEQAKLQDQMAIEELLKACGLPVEDLQLHLNHFIVAREENRIVGCIGLEVEGPLLRSLAVDPSRRNQGIAKNLCKRLIESVPAAREIYLLTTTAARFFERIGFERIKRSDAPNAIRENRQFTELCPSSAILMRKKLHR